MNPPPSGPWPSGRGPEFPDLAACCRGTERRNQTMLLLQEQQGQRLVHLREDFRSCTPKGHRYTSCNRFRILSILAINKKTPFLNNKGYIPCNSSPYHVYKDAEGPQSLTSPATSLYVFFRSSRVLMASLVASLFAFFAFSSRT